MRERDFIYRMRVKIFEEADKNKTSITSLCGKYYTDPIKEWTLS